MANSEHDNLAPFQVEHHSVVANPEAKRSERGMRKFLGMSEGILIQS
jgi:hypothetical protein